MPDVFVGKENFTVGDDWLRGVAITDLTTEVFGQGATPPANLAAIKADAAVGDGEYTGIMSLGQFVRLVDNSQAFYDPYDEVWEAGTSPAQPAVTVTINKGASQDDPDTDGGDVVFDVVFSEAVVGFTLADVVITGTAGGTKVVTIGGSGPSYTATVSGLTTAGTVIAAIPAGGAASAVTGVTNNASTSTDANVSWAPA